MKKLFCAGILWLTCISISLAQENASPVARPDAHAPIGVMGDHLHKKGEFMLSYRFMNMKMEDNRDGTNDLSVSEAQDHLNCKNAGGGTGASYLNDLLDVDITGAQDELALVYDSDTGNWIPGERNVNVDPTTAPDSTSTIWFDPEPGNPGLFFWNEQVGDWTRGTNIYTFGRSGNVDGAYLGIGGWQTGGYYYIHDKAYITSIHAKALAGEANKSFQIHTGGTSIFDFSLVNYEYNTNTEAIQLNRGDLLQIWCQPTGGPIKDIVLQLIVHWSHSEE